jgi:hypothetical protein
MVSKLYGNGISHLSCPKNPKENSRRYSIRHPTTGTTHSGELLIAVQGVIEPCHQKVVFLCPKITALKKHLILALAVMATFISQAQSLKWSAFIDTSTTFSSPRGTDLTGDGVTDIVMGGGLDGFAQTNGVNAINGVDGSPLWNFHTDEEMFGSAKFMDITGDGVQDVFIGGRYAEFYAINGSTGSQIWEFFPYAPTVSMDSGWYNFYNPQFVPDQNSDGTPDILVANGGNHSAPPWDTTRAAGMLMVIDALTGNVLAKDTMPDGEETYCSPVVVDYSGQLHIIYGSGGENDKGSLWRTTLADLMADNLENSTQLASDPTLGFIAPSSIADMNDDGILDIINQAYDGTIRCFDGSNNNLLWEVINPGTESSSGPTIGNFIGDATPDVFNVVYKGAAPTFTEFYQILVDGATGQVAWKDSIGDMHYGSSSAVDLDLNGRDEAIISVNYHDGVSFSHQILNIDFQNDIVTPMYIEEGGVNLAVTPLVEDIDNNGYLDFIFGYRADSLNPMGQNGFYVKCLEGLNTIPGVGIAWGSYQGTKTDGHYMYGGMNCGTVTASSVFQNITCNHAADGSVSVTPTAGVAPFTYLWNTGEITNSIDSMDVGTYSVIVTDSVGCYTELTFNAFDPYDILFGAIAAPACPGDSTGKATVNSSGCPCMFSTCVFDWDSGDSTKTATMLSAGWEIVTITHMDGCVVVDSVFIPESEPILDSAITTGIDCAIDPYASSSIELYLDNPLNTIVTWNTGDSTAYIDSLDVGWYYVDLDDTLRGCFYSDSVQITAPDTLMLSAVGTDLLCFEDSSGMINTLVTGGTPSYTYNWSNMDSTANITNLPAGYYSLDVTDSLGCMVQVDSILISEPPQLSVNVIAFWSDSIGTCDGGAIAVANGGTNPLNYLWDDTQSTANDSVAGLCEGTYYITVTDSNGCTAIDSVTILNTLGIDDLELTVSIYPNPTSGKIVISSTDPEMLNRTYYLHDHYGRVILEGTISSFEHNLDISKLASGVYFVEFDGVDDNVRIVKE